ncbi:MAG TPA: response regulator [Gammaproteobacteria bacterium]|jgi:CheY-like chemotaxis protein|nr:response regulator [Gammaproteobacteria bacterium]
MNSAAENPSPIAGMRVLLVEDEMVLAMSFADLLALSSCHVVKAVSVAHALRCIAGGGFDGALLDVNLGTEDIYPVADELVRRGIPLIFVTGYNRRTLRADLRERPLVHKPFLLEELEQVMAETFVRAT